MEAVEGEIVKPRKKRRDTRVRDKLFVDALLKHNGDATKAAMEVTNATTKASAQVIGSRMRKRNQEAIENAMTRYGLTQERVIKKHVELVDSDNENIAMKAVDSYYKYTKKDGNNDQNVTIHFNF